MEQALDFTLLSASSYIDIIGTEKKKLALHARMDVLTSFQVSG